MESYDEQITKMKHTAEVDYEVEKGWTPVCFTQNLKYDTEHYFNSVLQDALCFGFIFKAKNGVIYQKERTN